MKFENSRPHNLSLVMNDAMAKLKTTKAMKGFEFKQNGNDIYFAHAEGNTTFGYAEVILSEGFNGFRLYHVTTNGDVFMLLEHNLGAESHIKRMCAFAAAAHVKVPATMDKWLVKTLAKRLGRLKQAGPYLLKLGQAKNDNIQMLYKIQSSMGVGIHPFVMDSYAQYNMTESKAECLSILNAYNRLSLDVDTKHQYHFVGCGFYTAEEIEYHYVEEEDAGDFTETEDRKGSDTEQEKVARRVATALDDEDEEEEDDDDEGAETVVMEATDISTDFLNKISTQGLAALLNTAISKHSVYVTEDAVFDARGMEKRNALIEALLEVVDQLDMAPALVFEMLAKQSELTDADKSLFA